VWQAQLHEGLLSSIAVIVEVCIMLHMRAKDICGMPEMKRRVKIMMDAVHERMAWEYMKHDKCCQNECGL